MTPDIPPSDTIMEVLGNALVAGVPDTVRQSFEKLSMQLASTGPLATRIAGAADGLVQVNTWAQLEAIPGTRAGQPGQAIGPDAGTHTDPVVGGIVPNKGKYTWSMAPAGWRWIADYQAVTEETIDEVYDALATKANDSAVVKLTGDQAVDGVKTFSVPPTFPTPVAGTNNTQAATTAFVQAAISVLLGGAPPAVLDTLSELAAALGNDANFAATIANALTLKAPLNNAALTGTPTAPTAAPGTNTAQIATTAFIKAAIDVLQDAIANALALKASTAALAAEQAAREDGDTALADEIFEQTVAHVPGYGASHPGPLVVTSADGYLLQAPAMTEAYQSHDRAPAILTSPDGFMISRLGYNRKPPAVVNADQIRRLKQKLRTIDHDPGATARISFVGDSWSASTMPVHYRNRLVAKYGDAGPGWINLSGSNNNYCADGRVAVVTTGTWADQVGYEATPSTTTSTTSSSAAYKTVVGVGPISTAWLHFVATAGAEAFYSWGTFISGNRLDPARYTFGADQPLDLSTGFRIGLPTGIPSGLATNGYWALRIGRSTGTIKIGGLDMLNGLGGVIVDSLAKGGSNTDFWLTPPRVAWQTAYASLNTSGTYFLHGTNDQAGTKPDWDVAINFDHFRQRHLAASPAADLIYMTPCENFLGRPRLIKNISAAVREMALDTNVCHRDLQDTFGPLSRMWEYRHESKGGIRPLFNVDDVHPDAFTGMLSIAAANEELINF